MKKNSAGLVARVARFFQVHFWDKLMAAGDNGGLLRLMSGVPLPESPATLAA